MPIGSLLSRSPFRSFTLACSLLPLAAACTDDDAEDVASADQSIVGGALDNQLRPEIGLLELFIGANMHTCTATLVHPSIVLTAAHCMEFASGHVDGTFRVTSPSGNNVRINIDRAYAVGTVAGATDIGLVHLASPVSPSDAAPTSISSVIPGAGTPATVFGLGCNDRVAKTGAGEKRFIATTAGASTSFLCKIDSGGPTVLFGPHDNGQIFAVSSEIRVGNDVYADAVTHGLPALEAVKRLPFATLENPSLPTFAALAAQPGVRAITGDYNGDGFTDIALVGGVGWERIPLAFSDGIGGFTFASPVSIDFAALARSARHVVSGDFNGDGRADLALAGIPGWTSIPVALANPGATFTIRNSSNPTFAGWSLISRVQLVAGRFNSDGRDDLALVGGEAWNTLPVAFANGDGSFAAPINPSSPTFASWAQTPNVRAMAADFNGDGRTDIALAGVRNWSTIPLALANGDGTFFVTNPSVPHFPAWSGSDGKLIAGDFDGNGRADLAMVGVPGWTTIAFAFSGSFGLSSSFTAGNLPLADFPYLSTLSYFALPGRYKAHGPGGDGKRGIALLGSPGWTTIPTVFLRD